MNFHVVLLAKFEFPTRTPNESRLKAWFPLTHLAKSYPKFLHLMSEVVIINDHLPKQVSEPVWRS